MRVEGLADGLGLDSGRAHMMLCRALAEKMGEGRKGSGFNYCKTYSFVHSFIYFTEDPLSVSIECSTLGLRESTVTPGHEDPTVPMKRKINKWLITIKFDNKITLKMQWKQALESLSQSF